MDTQIDPQIKNLVSAIGKAETGEPSPEAYTQKGTSGEFGRYQFMPDTWKQWAPESGVDVNDMSITAQNKVAYDKVKSWKEAGLNPAQIASKWNSGDENKYKQNWKGINDKGVSYDTPAYTQKVSQYYNELKGQAQPQTSTTQQTNPNSYASQIKGYGIAPTTDTTTTGQTLSQDLLNRRDEATQAIGSIVGGKEATGQTRLSGVIQTAGAVAGGLGDVVNAGLRLIPGVKQLEDLIGQGVGSLSKTDAGQAVMKSIQDFSTEHPELSKDIGAGFNILTAIPILRGLGVVKNLAMDATSTVLKDVAVKSFTSAGPELIGTSKAAANLLRKNPDVFKDMVDRRLIGDIKGGVYKTGDAVETSWKTITDSNNEIKSTLKKLNADKYTFGNEDTQRILNNTLNEFPNSKFTSNTIINNGKKLTPQNGKLWDKFETGNASLTDINKLRSDLDIAIKSVYTSTAQPPIRKELGKSLADSMRTFIKDQAPETKPLFEEMTKQFDIQSALKLMDNKPIQPGGFAKFTGHLGGIGAGGTIGGMVGGTPGAIIGGMVGEKASGTIANRLAKQNITQGVLKRTGANATRVTKSEMLKKLPGLFGGAVNIK